MRYLKMPRKAIVALAEDTLLPKLKLKGNLELKRKKQLFYEIRNYV